MENNDWKNSSRERAWWAIITAGKTSMIDRHRQDEACKSCFNEKHFCGLAEERLLPVVMEIMQLLEQSMQEVPMRSNQGRLRSFVLP